jgi:transcriptional regulator with XRE-family HTH domain
VKKVDKLKIAKKLTELRENAKLSREQVAVDLGISYSAISAYETGDRIPRDVVKIKLAEYYKQTVQYIFF